jgi:hypothetical protein
MQVGPGARSTWTLTRGLLSGLAWHTDDKTLREKFEEFGTVDEAVSAVHCPLQPSITR